MLFDTKSVLLGALALLTAPLVAHAQSAFPFTVVRDSNGTLTRIELPVRNSILSEDEDVLGELRTSLRDYQNTNTVGVMSADAVAPTNADDRKVYDQAKAYLKSDLSAQAVQDSRLDKQYAAAKTKILQVKLYRLLAAPSAPGAFDREKAITDVVKEVLSQAGDVLGLPSAPYKVFEFLVDQYIESLESRRSFYQNQMLVLLARDTTLFTEKEKSQIRSSIYYSRLDWVSLKDERTKARNSWSSYGDNKLAADLKTCKGFVGANDTDWGTCFKQTGSVYTNRLVKKSLTSSSPSLAFDASKPSRVRDFRILMMLARLGVKLVPLPGLAKAPVNRWIDSQYVEQRKSEGFFFGYATVRSATDLANDILDSSVNPLIRK